MTRGAGQWGARPGPSLLRAFAAPAASREPGGSAAATRRPAGERASERSTRLGPRRRRTGAGRRTAGAWPPAGRAPSPGGRARRGGRRAAPAPGAQGPAGTRGGAGRAPHERPRRCRRSGVSPRSGPGIGQARGTVTPVAHRHFHAQVWAAGSRPARVSASVLRAGPPIWRAPGGVWREGRAGGRAHRPGAGSGAEGPVRRGYCRSPWRRPRGRGLGPRAWCPAGSAPGLCRGSGRAPRAFLSHARSRTHARAPTPVHARGRRGHPPAQPPGRRAPRPAHAQSHDRNSHPCAHTRTVPTSLTPTPTRCPGPLD